MKILKDELIQLWDITCPKCGSEILNKNGKYKNRQRFICLDCGFSFTTYTKSIFDSTKLDEDTWQIILHGIIHDDTLHNISEKSGVSMISLSKIRRHILDSLFSMSKFDSTMKQYYYDPFDSSSIFYPNQAHKNLTYYHYNKDTIIAIMEWTKERYISKSFDTKSFNEIMISVHYPNVRFESYSTTNDLHAISYMDQLLDFLKQYRGIKKDLLSKYCHFFDMKQLFTPDVMETVLLQKLFQYKRNVTY